MTGSSSLFQSTVESPTSSATTQSTTQLIPARPEDSPPRSSHQRKRTLSGNHKLRIAGLGVDTPAATTSSGMALPPPPSRTRKIIQMKPRLTSTGTSASASTSASTYAESSSMATSSVPPPLSTTTTTTPRQNASSATTTTSRRKAQPSSTSAAGRKIARKTAHSIIERRRRSKMNEEFGVLKDMIPACTGVEMHKLAILQAGIEYVRYLEDCIESLKAQNQHQTAANASAHDGSMDMDPQSHARSARGPSTSDWSEDDSTSSDKPQYNTQPPSTTQSHRAPSMVTSTSNSTLPSPDLPPVTSRSSIASYHARLPPPHQHPSQLSPSSASPAPTSILTPLATGVSPAFQAFQFSPDLVRSNPWSSAGGYADKSSPSIMPLPQAALPFSHVSQSHSPASEGHAEATATAALMMMGADRRASLGVTPLKNAKASENSIPTPDRSTGMSVRDLLSS